MCPYKTLGQSHSQLLWISGFFEWLWGNFIVLLTPNSRLSATFYGFDGFIHIDFFKSAALCGHLGWMDEDGLTLKMNLSAQDGRMTFINFTETLLSERKPWSG